MQNLPLPPSKNGPLLEYLNVLGEIDADIARHVSREIRDALKTAGGVKLMELLEIVLMRNPLPIDGNACALAARNAQGFILADLRRIASNELDVRLDEQNRKGGAGRTLGRRPR